VVEDDAMLGMLLGELLQDMGHEVCPIETTQAAAVAAAAKCRPDLMVVDVGLGEGSGLEAMDEILPAGFIPHIFMSGNIQRVAALRPGTPVLQKPFDEAQLERAIHRALAGSASPAPSA
jgi:DNA-binding response OmpR family regulator